MTNNMSTRRIHQCIMFLLCAVVSVYQCNGDFTTRALSGGDARLFRRLFHRLFRWLFRRLSVRHYRPHIDRITINSRYTRMFLICRRSIVRPHSFFSVRCCYMHYIVCHYMHITICRSVRMPSHCPPHCRRWQDVMPKFVTAYISHMHIVYQ